MTSWAVKIGDRWDHEIGGVAGTTYETTADGGMGDASFSLPADSDAIRWSWLHGQPVVIVVDGVLVWYGRVNEVDRETGGVTCISRWEMGHDYVALNSSGEATLDVAAAITEAQSLGWAVSRNGVAGTVLGDSEAPLKVAELLEMLAEQEGKRVGVHGVGANLFLRDDPTAPTWVLDTEDVRLSRVGERANAWAARYADSTTGKLATRYWPTPLPSPVVMETVDLTERGLMTASAADGVLSGAAALAAARSAWTNSIEVSLRQLKNLHGTSPSSPTAVMGGQMVRVPLDVAGQSEVGVPYLDVVLGSVVVSEDTDLVTLTPVGATPQSLEEAMEEVGAA